MKKKQHKIGDFQFEEDYDCWSLRFVCERLLIVKISKINQKHFAVNGAVYFFFTVWTTVFEQEDQLELVKLKKKNIQNYQYKICTHWCWYVVQNHLSTQHQMLWSIQTQSKHCIHFHIPQTCIKVNIMNRWNHICITIDELCMKCGLEKKT